RDWSSDVCSSDLGQGGPFGAVEHHHVRALLGAGGSDHLGVELVVGLKHVVHGHALVGLLEFLGVGVHQRHLVVVAEVVPYRQLIGAAAAGFGAGTTAATAGGQAQRQAHTAQGH